MRFPLATASYGTDSLLPIKRVALVGAGVPAGPLSVKGHLPCDKVSTPHKDNVYKTFFRQSMDVSTHWAGRERLSQNSVQRPNRSTIMIVNLWVAPTLNVGVVERQEEDLRRCASEAALANQRVFDPEPLVPLAPGRSGVRATRVARFRSCQEF